MRVRPGVGYRRGGMDMAHGAESNVLVGGDGVAEALKRSRSIMGSIEQNRIRPVVGSVRRCRGTGEA